ncbi:MAG: VWA domain-containing protein [Chitinophagales bacterium]|jgi:Mg-chelatase subunit ChlD|nr:VWA domain-containing protein [Sphingobacteriales bacterium]MBP7533567.1 VWA domain-containing protein [Chitinophagales bacterium]
MDTNTKWRLILGKSSEDCFEGLSLSGEQMGMDKVLDALYDSDRQGSLGSSMPNVNRWLGDIRKYFPTSVVQLMQKDALERLNLQQMLMEPETLRTIEPDVHLVGTLLSLHKIMPEKTKNTAREVVNKVVRELEKKLHNPTRQAIMGSLSRSVKNRRPKYNEIDWGQTIKINLKTYQPQYKTIIPELLRGIGRKSSSLRDIILCIDQSGSMYTSVVYASVFGAVLASINAVRTSMVVFDTAVVDLTELLSDPVEVLFGTQLGGGTDINKAIGYCETLVRRPSDTILVLISDLYEGGNAQEMLKRTARLVASGVQIIVLLALNDEGEPSYDHHIAAQMAAMGIPSFACTPDLFPDLMAAAINKSDINQWAARYNVSVKK